MISLTMNYGLRNTLILALVLMVLFGAGRLFVHYTFSSALEDLREEKQQKEQMLSEVSEMAVLYDQSVMGHAREVFIRDNHPKELFADPNTGMLYDYIRQLNQGISFTELNYNVQDSVIHDHHGVVRMMVNGEGAYRNFYNFIHRIENSRPIIHIHTLQLHNINEPGRLSRVNFQMVLHAYYNRDENLDVLPELAVAEHFGDIGHNPYYPLVHPVPPNEAGLVNVDESRLLGMTTNYVIIQDQTRQILRLSAGDPVYLGTLQHIDTDSQEAVFRLNRGGLLDVVTLDLAVSTLTEPRWVLEQEQIQPPEHERRPAPEEDSPPVDSDLYGLMGPQEETVQGSYTIVLHSITNENRVRIKKEKLENEGYKVTVRQARLGDSRLTWRIGVGQFESVSHAEQAVSRLPDPYRDNNFIIKIR